MCDSLYNEVQACDSRDLFLKGCPPKEISVTLYNSVGSLSSTLIHADHNILTVYKNGVLDNLPCTGVESISTNICNIIPE